MPDVRGRQQGYFPVGEWEKCLMNVSGELSVGLIRYVQVEYANMENAPKLESMPTLCRSATLPAETTISKWRVTATIRQLLQLLTGGTSAFGGLRAIASLRPHSNFRDAPVFQSHQLPFYGNECLEWQIPTQLP